MTRILPKLVVFDMAGTTIADNGDVPAAFIDALREHGVTCDAGEIEQLRGATKREAIRTLVPHDADAAYETFRRKLQERFAIGAKAVDGAQRVFAWLRARGTRIALNTGFDRDIAEQLMRAVHWSFDDVDVLVCGNEVANGRPAPDLILSAMAKTNVSDPQDVANVGDTTLDLQAASRAAVRWNIGVTSGAHRRDALERAPHTHIVASVAELPAIWTAAASCGV